MPGHQKCFLTKNVILLMPWWPNRLSQNVTKSSKETIWPLCLSMVAWITGDALLLQHKTCCQSRRIRPMICNKFRQISIGINGAEDGQNK
uniref:Uncharacterized protein n=1 Tax=Romanomermis culicivorax TaxID=13658 RepID=A0A915IMC5_ROMCU